MTESDNRMDCFSPPGSRVICDPLPEHAGDSALSFLAPGEVYTVLSVLAEDDASRVRLFEFPDCWLDARLFRADERRIFLAPGERLFITSRDDESPEEWIEESFADIARDMPGDEPALLIGCSVRLGFTNAEIEVVQGDPPASPEKLL